MARWANRKELKQEFPRATHDGTLTLSHFEIECANLPDGRRVLSRAGFVRAMGRRGKVKGGTAHMPESGLPVFLGAENLKPFLTKELVDNAEPVVFQTVSGILSIGYPAELLTGVCSLFLKADAARVLLPNQRHIVDRCRVLLEGFATVGINALVDEATGYQYARAKDALAKILEKFIAKELQPWTRTFPVEFYEQIFRLRGWAFDPATMRSPRVLGKYTEDIVYKRLAPGVLDELRRKNPTVDGRRKHKHFQWLTGEGGHPRLLAHLEGVKMLMRESSDWEQFRERLCRNYPIIVTTDLGFEVEVRK